MAQSKTKKPVVKKAAAKKPVATKKAPLKQIKMDIDEEEVEEGQEDTVEETDEEEGGGKIVNILKLFMKGFTPKEIVAQGYNKSTVYRQTGELKKLQKGPALTYYGHDLYEARIQRVMAAKKLSRVKAIEHITKADIASAEEGAE